VFNNENKNIRNKKQNEIHVNQIEIKENKLK
jgi:hypothetical protein